MAVEWCPSPNFNQRRNGLEPDIIVLHYTAMPSLDAAAARLCTTEHEVSAHYLVGTDGRILQLVAESHRAWHAGAGEWRGMTDINSRSIGVELANDGHTPFSQPQMHAAESLIKGAMARYHILAPNVIAHSDMAIGRKYDPGRRFDWRYLARQGLSVWPRAGRAIDVDESKFRDCASRFGYRVDHSIALPMLLDSFRMRFRPWANGELSPNDMVAIADLAARYPA